MSLIKGTTKLLGVIGDPVKHSLSPLMHNSALEELGLDYVYIPLPITRENLAKAIAGFEAISLVGFNITIPHKQAIIPYLAEITPTAQMVRAVNTVWRTDKGWKGTNTDVEGFIAPLQTLSHDWSKITPVILGNGGAARAVVVGLVELGCPKIHIVGRDRHKLDEFSRSWQRSPQISTVIQTHLWEQLTSLIPHTELLVNTTPVGMSPQVENSPVDASLMAQLPSSAIAYDLIYTPNPTQFLKLAREQGATAIDGLEMLVQQGAAALKIWLQQPVPIETMRKSLRAYLEI